MKKIEDMSVDEMCEEIKEFTRNRFKADKGYVFISYSHEDKKLVYKKVLEWIREGYNIAIDLDFENHSSDEDWIELMEKRLRSNTCVKAVCFRSTHYYFSYASLIELMLMRSSEIIRKRKSAKNPEIPIDIVELSQKQDLSDEILGEMYKAKYELIQAEKKEDSKSFLSQKEEEELLKGLKTFCENYNIKYKEEPQNAEEVIKDLNTAYEDGYINFYPEISTLMTNWFKTFNMNGNYKKYDYNASSEFSDKGVYSFVGKNEKDEDVPVTNTVSSADEEPSIKANQESQSKEVVEVENAVKGRVFSTTGDITYSIYGNKYKHNQSDMMLNVFEQIMKKHEDKVAALVNMQGMNCLSVVDYTKKENRDDNMPSYFRSCDFLQIAGGVCVGTAYDIKEKMRKIAYLMGYCGEDRSIFESEKVELPEIKYREIVVNNILPAVESESVGGNGEEYSLFGKSYSGNQSQMMIDAIKMIMERHFDERDKLATLSCVKLKEKSELKGITYFNSGVSLEYQGVIYSVGTSFGRDAKLTQIRKAIELVKEDPDQFKIEGLFNDNQYKKAKELYNATATSVSSNDSQLDIVDCLCAYLSKYNNHAAAMLGCKSISAAFEWIGQKYDIKGKTAQNIRDTFDPFFPESGRKGWWQNMDKISESRMQIVNKFKAFSSESEADDFIKSIIK